MKNDKLNTMMEHINSANIELAELKRKHKEKSQGIFKDVVAELFETYPRLKSIGFTAYTPYFNDGDVCEYSAHTDWANINGYGDFEEEDEDGNIIHDGEDLRNLSKKESYGIISKKEETILNPRTGKYVKTGAMIPEYGTIKRDKIDEEAKEIVDSVNKFLGSFDDDFWKELVGDHVKVKITKDGITTEEFEHE